MANVRMREIPGLRDATKADPTPQDLAAILDATGRSLSAEDIHVRRARVAHNQHDRTYERFQKAHLERFAETLPGKSLLPGHNTSALPLGRWYVAETRTRTEEFPTLVRKSAEAMEKGAEIIPGFETARPRVTWLEAGFFFAQDPSTEGLRKNIDLGVYQDVSIGFSFDDVDCDVCKKSYLRSDCPHIRGWRTDDGELVTLTYSGDPKEYEARETSIVYLGAQQHAELQKQLSEGRIDPQALSRTPLGEDLVRLKEAEAFARKYGHAQKAWFFPALKVSPSDGGERQPSDDGNDDPSAAIAALQEKSMEKLAKFFGLPDDASEEDVLKAAEAMQTERDTAKQAAEPFAAVDLDALKAQAAIGAKALTDLSAAYVTHCNQLGQDEAEAKAVAEMFAGKGDYEGLKGLAERKQAAVWEKFPAGVSGDPGKPKEDPEPKPTTPARPREYALV
jgi:hypothetical protein